MENYILLLAFLFGLCFILGVSCMIADVISTIKYKRYKKTVYNKVDTYKI